MEIQNRVFEQNKMEAKAWESLLKIPALKTFSVSWAHIHFKPYFGARAVDSYNSQAIHWV
ncbi:MAG: hypothetical protein HWD61_14430 [Parachlamydiaceae bacterium]|nr:MAG: hypothetical protein HWD61_14430 [Parachlamydiaceae bacterium]